MQGVPVGRMAGGGLVWWWLWRRMLCGAWLHVHPHAPYTVIPVQGTEGPTTAAAFARLQERTAALQQRAAAAAAKLEGKRQQVAEASAAAKDALRKCEALPAFKPGGAGGDAQALLERQPLEPALAALRCGACWGAAAGAALRA